MRTRNPILAEILEEPWDFGSIEVGLGNDSEGRIGKIVIDVQFWRLLVTGRLAGILPYKASYAEPYFR
jgi:hypothetical protein